jgi:hypothetical protein
MLPFTRFTWRSKALLSISAAIIAAGVMFVGFRLFGLELPRRPFDLFRANLSGQWLLGEDLRKANLSLATLSNANLSRPPSRLRTKAVLDEFADEVIEFRLGVDLCSGTDEREQKGNRYDGMLCHCDS